MIAMEGKEVKEKQGSKKMLEVRKYRGGDVRWFLASDKNDNDLTRKLPQHNKK